MFLVVVISNIVSRDNNCGVQLIVLFIKEVIADLNRAELIVPSRIRMVMIMVPATNFQLVTVKKFTR